MFVKPSIVARVCCPIKFAQYMACGVPIITNRGIGDVEKFVERYDVGYFVDVEDKGTFHDAARQIVFRLRSNSESVRKRCRALAETEFGLDKCVAQYYRILARYLDSGY
jgi:glycosyltransferase involved in cell wall biosynthesis